MMMEGDGGAEDTSFAIKDKIHKINITSNQAKTKLGLKTKSRLQEGK